MPSPNQTVQRKINMFGLNVDGYDECATIPYEIQFTKNGVDVSDQFEKRGKPMQWRNSDLVYQRDLTTFQPLPNPDYEVAVLANQLPETDPNYINDAQLLLIDPFLTAPAFDYFVGLFTAYPQFFWEFLGKYIDENYGDGWFGTQSRR